MPKNRNQTTNALRKNIIFEMDTKVDGHDFTEHDVQMLDLDKFM